MVVVGAEYPAELPPLLNPSGDGFNPAFFDSPGEAEKLLVRAQSPRAAPGATRVVASRRSDRDRPRP